MLTKPPLIAVVWLLEIVPASVAWATVRSTLIMLASWQHVLTIPDSSSQPVLDQTLSYLSAGHVATRFAWQYWVITYLYKISSSGVFNLLTPLAPRYQISARLAFHPFINVDELLSRIRNIITLTIFRAISNNFRPSSLTLSALVCNRIQSCDISIT